MATVGSRQKAAITGIEWDDGQPSTSRPAVKKEPQQFVFNDFDVAQADSLMFDESTKEAYEVF